VEHLENARDLLDQSINELRRVAHHLMPESLLRYGLKASLEDFIHSVPNAQFHYFGEDNRLDNRTEILIYRCVHELVNNALKYAKATTINVQLVQDSDRISLAVQDDGCGYDMESVTSGMGLKNLRDRVTAANGKLNVYSSPDKGTEVDVEVALTQSTR
jgi:signal transduction histidine kinase